MKTVKCDLCDHEAQGDTFEEWMNELKPHYGEAHAEVMKGKEGLSDEEKKAEMGKWMAENKARFDSA
jgi:predicted small metal-binding protein